MDKASVIAEFERMEVLSIIIPYGLIFVHNDNRVVLETMAIGDRVTSIRLATHQGQVEYDIDPVIEEFKKNNLNNLDMINSNAMLTLIYLHDLLKNNDLLQKTPEFEFFRHLRNAIGHGNRFTFKGNEPVLPARFENLVIDHAMNGFEKAVGNYVQAGDILNLLNFIKNQL